MTKEEFQRQVNFGRYPKYTYEQIKEGTPEKDCVSLICTESDNVFIGKYEHNKWKQARITSAPNQKIYYDEMTKNVIYWTDGEPKDVLTPQ